MLITENNCLNAKNSTVQQRGRTKRASKSEPQPVQVIHQIIIPEHPLGLIGEKVVYNEKYLKKCKDVPPVPLPPCGYFTILRAVLKDDGRVMVALSDCGNYCTFEDDTHTCIGNLKPHKKTDENDFGKKNINF